MQTHLDLMYDQLDTLVTLLNRESQTLHQWVNHHLSDWHQDDYHILVHRVDDLNSKFAHMWEHLLLGSQPRTSPRNLHTALKDIREFSSLLLNNHDLTSRQYEQLLSIHVTSADILDIVEDIYTM